MSRATNSTSVQVERVVLIKRLKERVKEMPKQAKEYEVAKKAYEQAVTDWLLNLVKDPANIKEVHRSSNYRNDEFANVYFTAKALKTKPKYEGPEEPRIQGYFLDTATREMTNTITILELSNSEYVGVSILNKVSQYL